MCGPILLALIGLPALEIYGILKVGQWAGAFETMLMLATAFMLGLGLIRGHSLAALRRIQMGAPPSPDVLAGPLIFVAAVLLMVPGFFSDLIALPLMLPPVRRLLASDGGAKSLVWMQIVAYIFQMPVRVLTDHPGSCLGAAWLAMLGSGADSDWHGVRPRRTGALGRR